MRMGGRCVVASSVKVIDSKAREYLTWVKEQNNNSIKTR